MVNQIVCVLAKTCGIVLPLNDFSVTHSVTMALYGSLVQVISYLYKRLSP